MDSDSLKWGIYFSSHSFIKEWKARHVWKVEDQTYQLQRKSLFVADAFRRPTYRWRWKASEANNAFNSELSTWHRQHTFLFHVFVPVIFILTLGTKNNDVSAFVWRFMLDEERPRDQFQSVYFRDPIISPTIY